MNYDIISFGTAAVVKSMEVDRFPCSGEKVRILSQEIYSGGMSATALVAASRFGATCWYGGGLGDNELSNFMRKELREFGVAVEEVGSHPAEWEPFSSAVYVVKGKGERTIFWSDFATGSPIPGTQGRRRALSAKVFYVDNNFSRTLFPLYQEVRAAGIPILGDFEAIRNEADKDAFLLINHPVLPSAFAREYASCIDLEEAIFKILQEHTRDAVVVTDGENGCWYAEKGDAKIRHHPSYSVSVIDLSGRGDVFHGAYTAGLVFGWDIDKRVQYASAAAAICAMRKGGFRGVPNLVDVEEFLRSQHAALSAET